MPRSVLFLLQQSTFQTFFCIDYSLFSIFLISNSFLPFSDVFLFFLSFFISPFMSYLSSSFFPFSLSICLALSLCPSLISLNVPSIFFFFPAESPLLLLFPDRIHFTGPDRSREHFPLNGEGLQSC